jgi:hypothetical protein
MASAEFSVSLDPNASGSCAVAGGIWPATQALLGFLVTNIFAHAVTIYLAPGTDTIHSVEMVYQALLLPVKAGDGAIHALWRYFRRWKTLRPEHYFGGTHFEDAATAGAIAVVVPLRYAPLLRGRWDSVRYQRLVMLDNKIFWYDLDRNRQEFDKVPYEIHDIGSRYVPFILPSRTTFPKYADYRISPQSSALAQLVAIVQLVLSIRQLLLQHSASIDINGLSSPFLVVVPFIMMTFINLLANVFVGSYSQIVVLPMEHEPECTDNQIFIGHWRGDSGSGRRVLAVVSKDKLNGQAPCFFICRKY